MLRGIYTSASGMLAEQRRMEVVANNLANVSTTGFKREAALSRAFASLLLQRTNDPTLAGEAPTSREIGRLGFGTVVDQTAARLSTGSLQETGSPLDVAIDGDGFFAVLAPQGVRYTRHGGFTQSGDGLLVSNAGHPVLVDGLPARSDAPMTIAANGEVSAGGRRLGRLTIATSRELGALRKEGDGLWTVAGGGEAVTLIIPQESTGDYQLRVGYREASNVDPATEMVAMMTIMRANEANMRAIQAQDEVLQKAVNEIGRVG